MAFQLVARIGFRFLLLIESGARRESKRRRPATKSTARRRLYDELDSRRAPRRQPEYTDNPSARASVPMDRFHSQSRVKNADSSARAMLERI